VDIFFFSSFYIIKFVYNFNFNFDQKIINEFEVENLCDWQLQTLILANIHKKRKNNIFYNIILI